MLDVDHGQRPVEINDIERKPHPQSMNAVAGDNPEAEAITEVTRTEAEQPTQAAPVRIGHS